MEGKEKEGPYILAWNCPSDDDDDDCVQPAEMTSLSNSQLDSSSSQSQHADQCTCTGVDSLNDDSESALLLMNTSGADCSSCHDMFHHHHHHQHQHLHRRHPDAVAADSQAVIPRTASLSEPGRPPANRRMLGQRASQLAASLSRPLRLIHHRVCRVCHDLKPAACDSRLLLFGE